MSFAVLPNVPRSCQARPRRQSQATKHAWFSESLLPPETSTSMKLVESKPGNQVFSELFPRTKRTTENAFQSTADAYGSKTAQKYNQKQDGFQEPFSCYEWCVKQRILTPKRSGCFTARVHVALFGAPLMPPFAIHRQGCAQSTPKNRNLLK